MRYWQKKEMKICSVCFLLILSLMPGQARAAAGGSAPLAEVKYQGVIYDVQSNGEITTTSGRPTGLIVRSDHTIFDPKKGRVVAKWTDSGEITDTGGKPIGSWTRGTSAYDLGMEIKNKWGSGDTLSNRLAKPLLTGSVLSTLNGGTNGTAQIACLGSKALFTLFVQPGKTNDLKYVSIKYVSDFRSKARRKLVINRFYISGACANGFISCKPGTWDKCRWYTWTYKKGAAGYVLGYAPVNRGILGGCFCFNKYCSPGGSFYSVPSATAPGGVVPGKIDQVLRALGGGIAGAMAKASPGITAARARISGTSISYYGLDSGSYSPPAIMASSRAALGNFSTSSDFYEYDLTARGRGEETYQKSRPDSMYSLLHNSQAYRRSARHSCWIRHYAEVVRRSGGVKVGCFDSYSRYKYRGHGQVYATGIQTKDGKIRPVSNFPGTHSHGTWISLKTGGVSWVTGHGSGQFGLQVDKDPATGKMSIRCVDAAYGVDYRPGQNGQPAHVRKAGSWIPLDGSGSSGCGWSGLSISLSNGYISISHGSSIPLKAHQGGKAGIMGCQPDPVLICSMSDKTTDGCSGLEQDPKCHLLSEIDYDINGKPITMVVNGSGTGLNPVVTCKKSFPNYSDQCRKLDSRGFLVPFPPPDKVCYQAWAIERTYVCTQPNLNSTTVDISRANNIEKTLTTEDNKTWNFSDTIRYAGEANATSITLDQAMGNNGTCVKACEIEKTDRTSPISSTRTSAYYRKRGLTEAGSTIHLYRICINGECPVKSGETMVQGCKCINKFNEAYSSLLALHQAQMGMICSTGKKKSPLIKW